MYIHIFTIGTVKSQILYIHIFTIGTVKLYIHIFTIGTVKLNEILPSVSMWEVVLYVSKDTELVWNTVLDHILNLRSLDMVVAKDH